MKWGQIYLFIYLFNDQKASSKLCLFQSILSNCSQETVMSSVWFNKSHLLRNSVLMFVSLCRLWWHLLPFLWGWLIWRWRWWFWRGEETEKDERGGYCASSWVSQEIKHRPDTSQRLQCLSAPKSLQAKFTISSEDALNQGENTLVLLPFQKWSIHAWKHNVPLHHW